MFETRLIDHLFAPPTVLLKMPAVFCRRILTDHVMVAGMKQGFTGRQEIVSEYPHTFHDVPDEIFPLFLTQDEFPLMLD